MENPIRNQEGICRLCLTKCDNFEIIAENTKDYIDILLLKMNLLVSEEPVICSICTEMVKKCSAFKSSCLNTHSYITGFINDKSVAKLDLKDVYINKQENRISIPLDHNLCVFCMELIKSCSATSLDDGGDNMLQEMMLRCIPELDLNIIKEPMICTSCHENLEIHFRFVTNCSVAEERIRKYCDAIDIINNEALIDLTDVLRFTLNNTSTGKEDGDTVDIIKEEKFIVNQEYVDEFVGNKNESFLEMENGKSNVLFAAKKIMACEEGDKKDNVITTEGEKTSQKIEISIKMEDQQFLSEKDIEIKTDHQDFKSSQIDSGQESTSGITTFKYQCDSCSFGTEYKGDLHTHILNEHAQTALRHCDLCPYVTRHEYLLQRHMVDHNNPLRGEMYQKSPSEMHCPNQKGKRNHLLSHKPPAVTTPQSKPRPRRTKNGVLRRKKDSSEVGSHCCKFCSFQTHNEEILSAHKLIHADPSEITSLQCEGEDIDEGVHTHLNTSKVKLYQCGFCTFKSKYKRSLNLHRLIHKDASEVRMYQCHSCGFQTKNKGVLKVHMLIHKDASQLTMFRCDRCPFQTKRNFGLRAHMLTHVNPSEVKMYHCASCPFQTKLKRNLRPHMLSHKNSSEVTMHQCEICQYRTKYRTYLKRHILTHKDVSEVTMYKCDFCSFQTKHKNYLKKHRKSHGEGPGDQETI